MQVKPGPCDSPAVVSRRPTNEAYLQARAPPGGACPLRTLMPTREPPGSRRGACASSMLSSTGWAALRSASWRRRGWRSAVRPGYRACAAAALGLPRRARASCARRARARAACARARAARPLRAVMLTTLTAKTSGAAPTCRRSSSSLCPGPSAIASHCVGWGRQVAWPRRMTSLRSLKVALLPLWVAPLKDSS
jgi:hypothetical protein